MKSRRVICVDLRSSAARNLFFNILLTSEILIKMRRTNLFFKVEVEHDSEDQPERLAEQIRRQLLKLYGVREVELSNFTTGEE